MGAKPRGRGAACNISVAAAAAEGGRGKGGRRAACSVRSARPVHSGEVVTLFPSAPCVSFSEQGFLARHLTPHELVTCLRVTCLPFVSFAPFTPFNEQGFLSPLGACDERLDVGWCCRLRRRNVNIQRSVKECPNGLARGGWLEWPVGGAGQRRAIVDASSGSSAHRRREEAGTADQRGGDDFWRGR